MASGRYCWEEYIGIFGLLSQSEIRQPNEAYYFAGDHNKINLVNMEYIISQNLRFGLYLFRRACFLRITQARSNCSSQRI